MGSIGRRLEALEGGDGCAVCGWGPDTEVEVVWGDDPRQPKYCPACGRPDELVIGWGDIDGA